MSIELMTGDNQAFVHLSWVAHGLDGTSGDGTYTWTCPVVDPPAPIYFYREFCHFVSLGGGCARGKARD